MSEHHAEIIIIKRKGGHGAGHHGGAWKIAFADFMTAMMAFFLVLWIINATDKDTKTVIARYFNPVKLENPARATKGVHGETSQPTQSDQNTGDSAPGAPPAPPAKDNKDAKASKSAAESAQSPPPSKKDDKVGAGPTRPDPPVPVDVKPTVSETALFSDPYQSLERIASGRAALSPAAAPDTGSADPTREAGALTVDAFRDPFKPIGPGEVNDSVTFEAATKPPVEHQNPDLEPQKADEPSPRAQSPDNTPNLAPRDDSADAAGKVSKELQQKLGALSKSTSSPAIEVKSTSEGLLISLTDRLTFSMFAIGSAEPRVEVVKAMESVARILKDRPGQIILRGHTDGRPYKGATYDNWRLSSARAQMAYYMLVRGGIPEARIDRVEGYADRALRDAAHPLAAENRRLEILLREPKP